MESLQNQVNVDNNITNASEEQKIKTVDDYVSVFNNAFLSTLLNRLTALLVKIYKIYKNNRTYKRFLKYFYF